MDMYVLYAILFSETSSNGWYNLIIHETFGCQVIRCTVMQYKLSSVTIFRPFIALTKKNVGRLPLKRVFSL